MRIVGNFYDNKRLADSFFRVQETVFRGLGLAWANEQGLLQPHVIPFALLDDKDEAISILNATRMTVQCREGSFQAVQLGTVATLPEHRGKGFAAQLQDYVQRYFANEVDFQFLFANETVLKFYPKFGFSPMEQKSFRRPIKNSVNPVFSPLSLHEAGVRLLKELLARRAPISKVLDVNDARWLAEFYCRKHFSEMLWVDQQREMILVAGLSGSVLEVHDLITPRLAPNFFIELSWPGADEVRPGFTPDGFEGDFDTAILENDQMFVKGRFPQNLGAFRVPALAHT